MGGAKKKSIKRMEKQQFLKTKKQQQQKKRSKKIKSKISDLKINIPNMEKEELIRELSKMRVITPYELASKYTMKISTAKKMISALKKKGFIQLVASNSNLKLYKYKQ